MQIKYYKVALDGIDKSGKDTICGYLDYLSGRRLDVKSRGVLSLIAYAKYYNRDYEYQLSEKDRIIVFIDVDKEDWEIRCKMSNEPKIDYEKSYECFEYAIQQLKDCHFLRFNSSKLTPYQIAKSIMSYLDNLEDSK